MPPCCLLLPESLPLFSEQFVVCREAAEVSFGSSDAFCPGMSLHGLCDPSYLKPSKYFNSSSSFHQHITKQLKGGLQTAYFISLFQRQGSQCRGEFCMLAKISAEQWTGRGMRPNSPRTRSHCPFSRLDVTVRLPVPLTGGRGNEIRGSRHGMKLWWEGCGGRGALERADSHKL